MTFSMSSKNAVSSTYNGSVSDCAHSALLINAFLMSSEEGCIFKVTVILIIDGHFPIILPFESRNLKLLVLSSI